MEERFQQVLQELMNADARKQVFAAFSSLRGERVTEVEMGKAIEALSKNPFYVAFIEGGGSELEFKQMALTSLDEAQKELRAKVEKLIDFTITRKNKS